MRLSKECGRVLGAFALATLLVACQQENSEQIAPASDVREQVQAASEDALPIDDEALSMTAVEEDAQVAYEGDDGDASTPSATVTDDQRPATPEDLLQALGTLNDALDGVRQGAAGADRVEAVSGPREHDLWTEAQPPLSVEFQTKPLTADMMSYRIVIRSMADRLLVYDVRLNRGNCGVAEVGEFKEGLRLPVALRYGQKKAVRVHRCDRVLEAVVDTQYGEYVFRWQ